MERPVTLFRTENEGQAITVRTTILALNNYIASDGFLVNISFPPDKSRDAQSIVCSLDSRRTCPFEGRWRDNKGSLSVKCDC